MSSRETFDYFLNLMKSSGCKNITDDEAMQNNLQYLIDRYHDTAQWEYMKEDIEDMINKKDIMGLGSYIFKAIQKYRKTILGSL